MFNTVVLNIGTMLKTNVMYSTIFAISTMPWVWTHAIKVIWGLLPLLQDQPNICDRLLDNLMQNHVSEVVYAIDCLIPCEIIKLTVHIVDTNWKYLLLLYHFRYDPKENKWGKVAPMTTRRLGVAVAVLGGFLYAIGGSDGQCPLNTGIYNF